MLRRGIGVESALRKWNMATLVVLYQRHQCKNPREEAREIMTCGFEKGQRVEDVTEPLRSMAAAADEWGSDLSWHLFSGDVKEAFDILSIKDALKAMMDEQTPPMLVAAIGRVPA